MTISKELGEKVATADTWLSLAEVSLEEGQLEAAASLVRNAMPVFETSKARDDEITANLLLCRILLAQGKITDAEQALRQVREWALKSQDPRVRPNSTILKARVIAAFIKRQGHGSMNHSRLIESLLAASSEARTFGFLPIEFDARLTLGEAQLALGDAAASRTGLAELEKDARVEGFNLIERKAGRPE